MGKLVRKMKISVRALVEATMMSGDIVSGSFGGLKTVEGIKGHKSVQKSRPDEYTPEVLISHVIEEADIVLEISGRIDGLYKYIYDIIIEEIKTTDVPLQYIEEDFNQLHWAQGKAYAYIYAKQNGLASIKVQLTYYNRETKDTLSFIKAFIIEELELFFYGMADIYIAWARIMLNWFELRDEAIKSTGFPFEAYRRGQRGFAGEIYRTLRDGGRLFAQAPTGIGKTMASIFPAVKALGEGHTSKLFYLTAKTITRTVAESALRVLLSKGLRLKWITITAKEKICFCSDICCKPEECRYAKGYYDRLRTGTEAIFSVDGWSREIIEEYARRYNLCPFEFSLDLSLWADCIICDYNYVFDPRVHLKRFFGENATDYTFLIDEAHNLVDRAREMYSAELSKGSFLKLSRDTKTYDVRLSKSLKAMNRYFIDLRHRLEEKESKLIVQEEMAEDLPHMLYKFVGDAQEWLSHNESTSFREELIQLYFDALSFLNTCENYDERYVTYIEEQGRDICIKLFCLDPSYLIRQTLIKGKGAIFFSATLTPIDYFRSILGGENEDKAIILSSPFPRENLCLLVAGNVSTKYANRERSIDKVVELIYAMVKEHKGNYIAFFPSYKYMNDAYERFNAIYPETRLIVQTPHMTEAERSRFLEDFSVDNEATLLGFAVMGGVFGEGIDLTGDRLTGTAIVGVGLPQLCAERDIILEYFQKTKVMGFEYAYMYPGMNKVMQAAGRVIRTETDHGVVLLIDERFSYSQYKRLFPESWHHAKYVGKPEEVCTELCKFWSIL